MFNYYDYLFPTTMLALLGFIWFVTVIVAGLATILERQNDERKRQRAIRDRSDPK